MKNNIGIFSECANCGACYNICPSNAISVKKDELFYKLNVDEIRCLNCGACVTVCPWNNPEKRQNLLSAYGGYSKSKDLIRLSSSGGAFSIIANYIINLGGIVYGATFSDDNKEVLLCSSDECDLDNLRRSKYVESLPGLIFREINAQLSNNRKVLFCGTPCQVAGLKKYLRKEYDNLYTCDFACGGLPSHKLYSAYISDLEKEYNSKIESVNFRPKDYGWGNHSLRLKFKNNKIIKTLAKTDPYFYSFLHSRVSVRENCYKCKFSNNHYSDIILADLWKYNSVSTIRNDNTGISLIISNTKKGEDILEAIKKDMVLEKLDLSQASYNCINKTEPGADFYLKRSDFFNNYYRLGIKQAAAISGMPQGLNKLIFKFKTRLRLFYKKFKGNNR